MKKSKKTTASKKAKEKKDVKELSQTHGKVEKENFEPTTLDQIWGDKGSGTYGTLDENEYLSEINEYNRADLQSHASKLGIVPIDDRGRLTKQLMSEFRLHVANFRKPSESKQNAPEISKEVQKILSEGR